MRSQLKRGLDRLRDDLDRRYGDRRTWAVLAASLGRTGDPWPGAKTSIAELSFLGGGIALVGAIALLGGMAWFGGRSSSSRAREAPASTTAASRPKSDEREDLRRSALEPLPESATAGVTVAARNQHDGSPVPELEVWLEPLEGRRAPRESKTDGQGRLQLAGLEPGAWRVTGERGEPRWLDLAPGEIEEVTLWLPKALAAQVIVVGPDRNPEPASEILLSLPGRTDRFRVIGESDAEGRFFVSDVDAEVWIAARKEGFAPSHAFALTSASRSGEIRLQLARSARASGCVIDREGRPIPGATISARGFYAERPSVSVMGVRVPPPLRETVSDEGGRFAIDKDRNDINRFVVSAPGFSPRVFFSQAVGSEPEELEITLHPPAVLAGRVLGPDGLPSKRIRLRVDPRSPFPSSFAQPDETGAFRFEGLPDGELALCAFDEENGLSAFELMQLAAGEQREVLLMLGTQATIRGRLLGAAGSPLSNWTVTLEEQFDAWERIRRSWTTDVARLRWTRTRADGSFAFGGLGPTEYELRAGPENDPLAFAWRSHTNVRPGPMEIELRIPASAPLGGLRGLVAASVSLPEGAFLSLSARAVPRALRIEVDPASGRFGAESIAAGNYVARLSIPGHPLYELGSVRVEAGARTDLGTLALPDSGSLALAIRDGALAPIDELEFVILGAGTVVNSAQDGAGIVRDAEGTLVVGPLWPGEYQVALSAAGFADHLQKVSVRSGERARVEVTLVRGILLELVVSTREALEPRSKIELELERQGRVVLRRRVDPTSDPTRLFAERVNLEAGLHRLEVRSDCGRRAELTFRADDLDFPLARLGRLEVELELQSAPTD